MRRKLVALVLLTAVICAGPALTMLLRSLDRLLADSEASLTDVASHGAVSLLETLRDERAHEVEGWLEGAGRDAALLAREPAVVEAAAEFAAAFPRFRGERAAAGADLLASEARLGAYYSSTFAQEAERRSPGA